MSAEIAEHIALCRSVARRFTRSPHDREDLEQVAYLGLLKSLRKYEPERGVPFRAFARRNICGELLHFVRDFENAVRMPRAWWDLRHRERALTDASIQRDGRIPNAAEIAHELGVSAMAVALMRGGISTAEFSLDTPAAHESTEQRIVLGDAIAALPPLERAMILGVYFCGYSQSEIGTKFGIPQRRASRLHARALHHLRSILGEI